MKILTQLTATSTDAPDEKHEGGVAVGLEAARVTISAQQVWLTANGATVRIPFSEIVALAVHHEPLLAKK